MTRMHRDGRRDSSRALRRGLTFCAVTCLVATVGYVLAGWRWVDALYMVTITVFGVGYGEVQPLESMSLKLFTMAVILSGCSSLIYVIGGIVQMLAEGEIERMLGIRNRSREIAALNDHTIICGYGRIGQMLAAELQQQGQPLVILDHESSTVDRAIDDGFLAMEGNCVDDETLQQAGIFRAKVLATVLPDDATNVFVTLSARGMSDAIRIIARAECPTTEQKLMRSGANHVVMPAAIGALRVAHLATRDDSADDVLPENRYRMLSHMWQKSKSSWETPSDESAQPSLTELSELAADVSQAVSEGI
jgi:voltage-gated potassium channel